MKDKILEQFARLYAGSASPLIIRSPGRINIIGEHTDYNEGFVLPAAIDKAIYVALTKRGDDEIHLYAADYNESHIVNTASVEISDKHWPNYILGVVDQLQKKGFALGGFNLLIDGDVPLGAGLSSSAAVECATAFALNELFGLGLSKLQMVQAAQKAEHVFAGVMCGIMDQFASMFGKKDHVIRLDCRSIEYEYVPFELKNYKILLLNTNVKHSLSSSAYNERRRQCEQGVAWVKEYHSEVISLRDVTMQMLDEYVLPKDALIYKRCKYIVEEIRRLLQGCADLQQDDIKALGKKMFRTHEGLSKEYEVSCGELDFLVDAVKDNPDIIGARMMGGGFGGCTINIIKEDAIESLVQKLKPLYKQAFNKDLDHYIAGIENGTSLVHQNIAVPGV
ncbi:galactokinase [Parafilimonas sp.]|uniref:galactokinase n=1 Tax=Parafilimonas sp. TaxID=1969739 RepID=UPI0039E25C5A